MTATVVTTSAALSKKKNHLFHLFIDWSELVGFACSLVGVVGFVFLVCFLMLLTNLCDRVVYR